MPFGIKKFVKRTAKKVKRTARRGVKTVGKVQRRSDRFVARNVRKATSSTTGGVSKAARRVAKTRITTNVSKGPFTSAFKLASKGVKQVRKVRPFSKLTRALKNKKRGRPRR